MSRTDLEGFLRNDDPSLNTMLLKWFSKGDGAAEAPNAPKTPAMIKIEWRVEGASSFEQLHTITLTSLPSSTMHLLQEIQERVMEKLGPQPIGQIRARGWGSGSSGSPGLNFTRTLAAVTMGHPDVSLLKAENLWFKRQHEQQFNLLVQAFAASQVTIQQLVGHNTNLATQRAATSSVADLSSPFAALAGYILYENRDKLKAFMEELTDKTQNRIRSDVVQQAATTLRQIPTGINVEDVVGTLTDVLDQARHDPNYRARILRKMQEMPPEVRSALNTFGFEELANLEDSETPPKETPAQGSAS